MVSNSLAIEAAQLMDRIERLVRAEEARRGVNPAQWEALRYLARANRFSRTPAALADYLGATRGTVSQSLIALEAKGLVVRRPSMRDKRSVAIELLEAGRETLKDDPLHELAQDLAVGRSPRALSATVDALRDALRRAIQRNGNRPFGVCQDCRHFRRDADGAGAHACALVEEPLTTEESYLICAEQEPAEGPRPAAISG
jgi:DNA-binding MarR family transcriptional regulator